MELSQGHVVVAWGKKRARNSPILIVKSTTWIIFDIYYLRKFNLRLETNLSTLTSRKQTRVDHGLPVRNVCLTIIDNNVQGLSIDQTNSVLIISVSVIKVYSKDAILVFLNKKTVGDEVQCNSIIFVCYNQNNHKIQLHFLAMTSALRQLL